MLEAFRWLSLLPPVVDIPSNGTSPSGRRCSLATMLPGSIFLCVPFRLGPPDSENKFYVHRTRVVFPTHPPLAVYLQRPCPGVGPSHRHVALKGCREGTRVTRCTEAGAYARDFVTGVVGILQAALVGGGGSFSDRSCRTGGAGKVTLSQRA